MFALIFQLIEDPGLTAAETSDRGRDGLVLQTPMAKVATRVIKRKEMMATHLPGTADNTTDVDTIHVEIKQMIVPLIDREMKLNPTTNRRKSRIDHHHLGEIDADLGKAFG